jgi:predicted PilT family ATPase
MRKRWLDINETACRKMLSRMNKTTLKISEHFCIESKVKKKKEKESKKRQKYEWNVELQIVYCDVSCNMQTTVLKLYNERGCTVLGGCRSQYGCVRYNTQHNK